MHLNILIVNLDKLRLSTVSGHILQELMTMTKTLGDSSRCPLVDPKVLLH